MADADIQRAAAQTERVFKSAIDNINRSIKGLGDTLAGVGRNLPASLGGGRGSGRNPADDTLKLAQAQARLQQVSGNTAQSIKTLQAALDGSNASSLRQLTAQTQLQRLLNQNAQGWRRYASTIREAGESIQQAGYGLLAVTGGIVAVGRSAVQSAINIDKQVNSLRALTGSAAAAEERFKALFTLAQRTPGLTTNLALTLDAQLRAANVSEANINKLLPSIGRINAVSPLGDPQKFAQNLIQLITQNFERTDLKELVGQSPIAGRIISQIFNVDNPTNAKAIRESAKKLGINSTDAFFKAFGEAAATNPALANVTESIGTQIEKLQDRIAVALRPLGLRILQTILPVIERVVPVIERLLQKFGELPPKAQTAILGIAGLAAAIGPAVIALGGLIQLTGAVGNLISVVTALGGAGATAAGVAGTGGLAAIAAGLAPLLPLVAAVGGAVALLAAGWLTDFGGMREATSNAFDSITKEFDRLGPVQKQVDDDLKGLRQSFQDWSDESRPIVASFWDFFAGAARGAISGVAVQIRDLASFTSGALAGVIDGALKPASRTLSSLFGGNPQLPANPLRIPRAPFGTTPALPEELIPVAQQNAFKTQRNNTLGSSASDKEAKAAANRERAIAKAGLDARLSDLQNFAKEANAVEKRQLQELQDVFDDGKIATGDYYRERLNIQQYALDAEIAALKAQQAEVQKAISTAKDQERIRLSEKFRDLQTEINNKIREQGELSIRNLREFKKAVGALPGVDITKQEEVMIPQDRPKIIQDALEKNNRLREEGLRYNQLDSELSIKEIQIQNAVNAGVLTEVEGRKATLAIQREYRDALIASLESEQQLQDRLGNTDQVRQLSERIERLKGLGVELDNTQRFLRGVGSGIEDVGDAFERFGQNVSNSFRDVRNLFDNLKNAIKSFFADLLGNSLQKLVKGTLGALFGQQGQQAGGGNQNPFASVLSGIFGGGGQQGGGGFGGIFGGGGGGFLTPGFNPNAGGGGLGSLFGGGGLGGLFGGAATPASVSLGGLPLGRSFPVGLSAQPGGVATGGGGFGGLLGSLGLGSAFKGLGFGQAVGSGGALAAALPFLGVNLGIGVGGPSGLGKVIGGVGGGLLGVGLSAAPAIFGAGGALASPAIAALFSNPFTAIAGAGLLVGAYFLGKAKQRRKDEQASGNYLQDAIDSIRDLRSGIARDEIDGKDARSIFNKQILETFKQQISTLKTKSVRESRLTNQVNDLKKLYADEVVPEIEKQRTRKQIFGKLTPEFATGGIMPRDGFAYLHKDEIIVNRSQQSPQLLRAASQAGVPGVNSTIAAGLGGNGTIVLNIGSIKLGVSKTDSQEIVIEGMDSEAGYNIVVNHMHNAQTSRDYRKK